MSVKTTRYFAEQVLRKRPYLQLEWCAAVIEHPLRREIQTEGRIRFWGMIVDPRDGARRVLRVVPWTTAKPSIMLSSTDASGRTSHEAALLSRNRQPLH